MQDKEIPRSKTQPLGLFFTGNVVTVTTVFCKA